MEKHIHCPNCGEPTLHTEVVTQPEQDEAGRTFHRMECTRCGIHARVYADSNDAETPEHAPQATKT